MNPAVALTVATVIALAHAPSQRWIDEERGLAMEVAPGFTVDDEATDGLGELAVESEEGGVYRRCSARRGPGGEEIAATINQLGGDADWVRSVCEDTAYPDKPLRSRAYLAGATDDTDLGPRHACVVGYEADDPELDALGLAYSIRQQSMLTAGPDVVILTCTLAARDEAAAMEHFQQSEAAFVGMRSSITRTSAP